MVKGLGNASKGSILFKAGVMFAVLAATATFMISVSYSEKVNKGLADNLIRLHVIANSDSDEDQAIKREVRDAVLLYMKEQLKDSRDIEQTKYIIRKNLGRIEEIADSKIAEHGKRYTVKTMLGSFAFPTKAYGDITLPAGNYQALRIVIGKGEGANWWCVLFPPLCFVDATHGTVPDSVKQELRATLTEDEYSIIVSADKDEDIPIKIRFKVVEFFQDTKIKFSGMISRLFK